MENANTVEVVVFELTEGVNRDQFLEHARITQEKVAQFDGFINRQLLEGENGWWTDIVWWESMSAAQSATETIMQDDACMPFMQAINPETMNMMHLHPVTLMKFHNE